MTKKIIVVEKQIKVVSVGTVGPAGPVGGNIIKTAGEILSGHKAVMLSDNKAYYGSSDNPAHVNKVIGISINAALANASVNITAFGEAEDSSWSWDTDKAIYLGLNGSLVQIPPSAGFIQQIATVITTTKIFVNIKEPVVIN